jgi:hypothetical protein
LPEPVEKLLEVGMIRIVRQKSGVKCDQTQAKAASERSVRFEIAPILLPRSDPGTMPPGAAGFDSIVE